MVALRAVGVETPLAGPPREGDPPDERFFSLSVLSMRLRRRRQSLSLGGPSRPESGSVTAPSAGSADMDPRRPAPAARSPMARSLVMPRCVNVHHGGTSSSLSSADDEDEAPDDDS